MRDVKCLRPFSMIAYVTMPFDYEWSSFKTLVERDKYQVDWATIQKPDGLSGMDLE